jgi:hypothetical protein
MDEDEAVREDCAGKPEAEHIKHLVSHWTLAGVVLRNDDWNVLGKMCARVFRQNQIWSLAVSVLGPPFKETTFACCLFQLLPKRSCNASLCHRHQGNSPPQAAQMFNMPSKLNTYP